MITSFFTVVGMIESDQMASAQTAYGKDLVVSNAEMRTQDRNEYLENSTW
jgi:hypothetical protein